MLRVAEPVPALNASEQFALSTLLDLSRVLVSDGDATVELRLTGTPDSVSIAECRARHWGVTGHPGAVELRRTTLRLIADLAGVVAEQRSEAGDRYGRVPPSVNALVASGLEREPVVHGAAKALRDAVIVAGAGRGPVALLVPWPGGARWALAMTHDLDVVSAWPAFTALRVVELLRKGDLGRASRALASATGAILGDPIASAARHIVETELRHDVRSTWFVITGSPTLATARAGDVTYTPETPRARRIVSMAQEARDEIGLHGSFETYVDAAKFSRQRQRLRAIAGREITGVRQHFLRMRPGTSHRAMADAGFQYDSTYGFPDRNGFRLGIADVTRVWHERDRQALPIDTVPFVWMDRALSKYRGVEVPAAWIEDGLELASVCRTVEGVWTGIWHPNLTPALGYPGAPRAFEDLVRALMDQGPWSACMSDIVAWRRARRDARGAGVDATGRVRLRAADARVKLEDPEGKPLPSVAA